VSEQTEEPETYRDLAYVRAQTEELARQLRDLSKQ
jgi:hypothetical protein